MKITNYDPNAAPTLGGPTISTGDPGTTDYGGGLSSTWLNTTTGDVYVLVSITAGTPPSATWVSTTAVSVFNFSTTDGTTTVDPTTSLTFVGATLADLGGGDAELTFGASGGGMVPYYIPGGDTFTVPLYSQALFKDTIEVDGILVVNGRLLGVD